MEKELIRNILTFKKSADLVYQNKDFTSATILLFKTLFVALDLVILRKVRLTPKDHTERFRILEKDFPPYYLLLDKFFSVYRSTYSTTIDEETCKEVKDNVEKVIKDLGI